MKLLDRCNILAVILLVEAEMVRQVAVWMNLLPRLNYIFSNTHFSKSRWFSSLNQLLINGRRKIRGGD